MLAFNSQGDVDGKRLESPRLEMSEVWQGIFIHLLCKGEKQQVQMRNKTCTSTQLIFTLFLIFLVLHCNNKTAKVTFQSRKK